MLSTHVPSAPRLLAIVACLLLLIVYSVNCLLVG
jgi:hypothetical protein